MTPREISIDIAIKRFVVIIGAMIASLEISACADFAARLRKHTYPPNFHYITDEQLRSTMWRLAFHSRELRARMDSGEEAVARRAEILSHLEGMERAAADLNRSGWPTNHPLIDANHANLLRDIRTAQAAIRRDPPSFLLAGSVAGACAYCHPSR